MARGDRAARGGGDPEVRISPDSGLIPNPLALREIGESPNELIAKIVRPAQNLASLKLIEYTGGR
jgi:hypothetical protein